MPQSIIYTAYYRFWREVSDHLRAAGSHDATGTEAQENFRAFAGQPPQLAASAILHARERAGRPPLRIIPGATP